MSEQLALSPGAGDPRAGEPPHDDSAARRRVRSALDESLIVEAAAGTGKTTELVRRLVAVLEKGKTRVDRVVAVTFTRKAAGELKLRLRQSLDEARSRTEDAGERRALEDALARLEEAHIGTIHSFCAEILRERPVEARVDPAFRELDEDESARLYDRAFRSWIERRLGEMPEGLRRALSRLARERAPAGSSPLDRLRDAGRSLVDWRDFPAPWRREPFDREAAVAGAVAQVLEMAALVRQSPNRHDYLRRALDPADALATWIRRSDAVSERDGDELEAQLLELARDLRRNFGWRGRGKWFAPGVTRDDALAARDALMATLDDFRLRADAELAALLRRELAEVIDGYEELKRRTGHLDFLDLLIAARDVVRGDAEVRRYLQQRFTHVFVDEFQDTDPLQAELLLLLAADDPGETDWRRVRPVPGKLFLVGDPKQSIYRFRRADVVLYQDVKARLTARGVGLVHMTRSFRALPPLQNAINAAFRGEMTGDRDRGQPDYVPLDPHRPEVAGQPQLVALPAPRPYGWSKIAARAVEECLPDAVAAFLEWLIEESRWTVEDPDERGRRVPIAPRHVAILFRRFMSWGSDVTHDYVRALEARNVPHLLLGGRSFHQREEVETLRAALAAVEWPDDELSVYATLRGSLFAVPDNLLLRYRFDVGTLHPFRVPEKTPEEHVAIYEALRLLARLHRQRNRLPIVETVHQLLEFTRAHAGFALRPAGHQVLANVQRICDLARGFEVRGGLSFRGFVERLAAEAERPGSSQSPVLEEGADGVRIMTAHAAKGLEFPIVVLADVTARLAREEPGLYVDAERGLCAQRLLGCTPWELHDAADLERARDAAEGVRLAYVAATRARDLLVVPAVGDEPYAGGWASPLNKAIYPEAGRFRDSSPAPGCPPFGETTVLQRTDRQAGEPEASVRPGLHRPRTGDHRVVWWDPRALRLGIEGDFGVRREKILSEDDPAGVDEGSVAYHEWRSSERDAREDGSVPRVELTIVTQAEEPPPDYAAEIAVETLPRAPGRPAGIRFGTLVHTVLRDVGFADSDDEIRRLAELHGRMLDAGADEVAAAGECVSRALAHPVMRRAASAARCHREAPFVLRWEGNRIVEGTIDLLFAEDGERWTVVDFKTDVDAADLAQRYHRQLAWYLFAVERMMKAPASGILLSL
jgi:ATP-dependent exoDNAse (exonuclease V) beta subunit